jgi:hypothetical protein
VRQAGDEAEGHQRVIVRRQGAGEVAQGEEAHQQQKQVTTEQPRSEDRQQRRADHHAERVGADHMADLRLADGQAAGDLGHQPHDGELAGADGETTHGQRQFDQQYGACGKGWHRCGGLRRHGHLEE